MTILCPHCNFEIALVGVRPGRFSPKCQSCAQTFTLYVEPGNLKHPMAATSHIELHQMCLRMGKKPPKPYPTEVAQRGAQPLVRARELVGAASAPVSAPVKSAIIFDMLGETDTVEAITDDVVEAPRASPPKDKARAPKARQPLEAAHALPTTVVKRRRWMQFKRRHFLWLWRRFGTPLDWIFASWIRVALGVVILTGFSAWWLQNKGDLALQRAVQSAVATASTRREVGAPAVSAAQQSAGSIHPAQFDSDVPIMTSQSLQASWLSEPLRRALSGWNACLAGLLILASAFCRGRLFAMAIILAAAIAMIGHWYDIPRFGQPLPWMTATAAGVISLYAFLILRRPKGY